MEVNSPDQAAPEGLSSDKPKAKTATQKTGADGTAGKKRVVIQKPYGVTDSHCFVGFNSFEAQVAYDVPVDLPVDVIEHLRGIERVQYRADESGKPVAHYTRAFSIIDA